MSGRWIPKAASKARPPQTLQQKHVSGPLSGARGCLRTLKLPQKILSDPQMEPTFCPKALKNVNTNLTKNVET